MTMATYGSTARVQMLLENAETHIAVLLARGGDTGRTETLLNRYRTALQNPDLSRAELAGLLRRAARVKTDKQFAKGYWSGFMARYVTQNANSNLSD